ncbi:4-(cytidine 5'-diphospho)-2-C-methyl-D-erythritol kinase [Ruicaihuangia caeni]|uniref:4-diphosphocytidyl-2-C-methyl-D-erythritol kinase n=1 Tax=Ruicaihuangia caeni TaxID=3042517 RepID=A0AAW6TB17_9MICO|nr:4-(cytidine 5'-diphospho)-2-C-methyl-D-erythritol kinase [Klugiella sp. YN-L-19]MDI2099538.1 4-(cytidine 5'-diphospho)-2-C-methyl-D-erythritol kinase [Klugiella sp. YN-L-19]
MSHRAAAKTKVHVRAPGKINVFLKVGRLQDDGYHDVASAYQAVSLFEDVRAYQADDFSVSVTGSVDLDGVPTDETNIAVQAAKLLARETGHQGGVHLEIEKHVPAAGGMGGGSADAAAALLACDHLWGTALPRERMLELAAELGADVPFALTGGTAIGTGRGDKLSPALAQGHSHWVLVLPDSGLSTPEVYHELDRHRQRNGSTLLPVTDRPEVDPKVLQALRAGDPHMLAESMHNDLQAAALQLEPALIDILELGEANGALTGIVSGSGPTIAFLAADVDSALDLQVALSAARLDVVRVSGPVHGARVLAE